MEEFNQEEFNKFIVKNDVYGFFEEPITLKSGRVTHFYANWRNVVEDVFLTDKLANFVIKFIKSKNIEVDTFYGVPDGASKLGIITQYKWAQMNEKYAKGSHVLAMGRKTPKNHGMPKDKYFVGMPAGKVVVIEDTTTTGGSLIEALKRLSEAGVHVECVISLTNRMELRDDGLSVKEAVENEGYTFFNMSSSIEILPLIYEKLKPSIGVASEVEKYFERYGIEKISLLNLNKNEN